MRHACRYTLAALPVAACGADGAAPGEDAGVATDAASSVPIDSGPPPCSAGETQPCVCAHGGIGASACSAGKFTGACVGCEAVDTPSGTLCVPGRYVGVYDMPKYYPTPAGLCGLVTVFGGGGKGSWAFTLGASGGAEFVEVVGPESCLELDVLAADAGVGDAGTWTDAPEGFDAGAGGPTRLALTGSVDCATGKFTGEVRGSYAAPSICGLGADTAQYFMKGPVTATFDVATRSFVDGAFALFEPPSLLPIGEPAGGEGTWGATLDTDAGAVPSDGEDCLRGVEFVDFDLP